MKCRAFMCMAAAGVVTAFAEPSYASEVRMDIYKDPSCGHCGAWAAAMVDADFNVVVHSEEFMVIKTRLGIPENMHGCHTAVVGDYFFEGHVPLEAVERVLKEKPQIAGLAVPGTPECSLAAEDDSESVYEVFSLSKPDMRPSLYMRIDAR